MIRGNIVLFCRTDGFQDMKTINRRRSNRSTKKQNKRSSKSYFIVPRRNRGLASGGLVLPFIPVLYRKKGGMVCQTTQLMQHEWSSPNIRLKTCSWVQEVDRGTLRGSVEAVGVGIRLHLWNGRNSQGRMKISALCFNFVLNMWALWAMFPHTQKCQDIHPEKFLLPKRLAGKND